MRLLLVLIAIVAVALFIAARSDAHLIRCGPKVTAHTCDHRNQHHALTALEWVDRRVWGKRRREIIRDHTWLLERMSEKIRAYHDRLQPSGIAAAWAWYRQRDTQCVTNHEGGWASHSIDPPDVYAGRFQMDYSFERETAFGRRMSDRYGRAWNWPPWAQVYHAWEVWSYAGWSRWPTFARYCA